MLKKILKAIFPQAVRPKPTEQLDVYYYSQSFVDAINFEKETGKRLSLDHLPCVPMSYSDHNRHDNPLSRSKELGPTRLLVVIGDDGAIHEYEYTATGYAWMPAGHQIDQEKFRAEQQNADPKIVWMGYDYQVIYAGPRQYYNPEKEPDNGPEKQQQKAFLYSPGYVDDYLPDLPFPASPFSTSDVDYGPTRLLVVKGPDGQLRRHEYTLYGDIDSQTTDEDALKIHGNRKSWLVWRGPESEIVFYGPHKMYRDAEATPDAPSVDS